MGVKFDMENDNKIKMFLEKIFGKNKKMLSENNEITNKNDKFSSIYNYIFSNSYVCKIYIF